MPWDVAIRWPVLMPKDEFSWRVSWRLRCLWMFLDIGKAYFVKISEANNIDVKNFGFSRASRIDVLVHGVTSLGAKPRHPRVRALCPPRG